MIHGVIFDLGSTLIYSEHDGSWNAILPRMRVDLLAHLQSAGYRLDPQAFLNRFTAKFDAFNRQRLTDWVEYTTSWILATTLEELGAPPPSPEVVAGALQAYYAFSESLWRPMPHAHATVQRLAGRGLKLGLISNAGDDANVQRLIDRADLRRYFDPIIVSAAVGVRKPNPEIFKRVLNAWQLKPDECVMVGDTLGADILGAQLTGLHNVWLTAQADHPANHAHAGNIVPEAEIASLAELPDLIESWPSA
jgi:HAD superfamily hydrolase (TIGR01549 family)